eukprot:TRINITY_DN2854_c0_g1_i1.p1 TRINITY_DN2854_c0_g1~~TRINITY_DN2854_c0_g1_i1.p1  ORF type:complete len:464 (+),score=89.13 TRINITY_DN2854_c0_g1_i1:116-1507(+)
MSVLILMKRVETLALCRRRESTERVQNLHSLHRPHVPRNHWNNLENQRAFLQKFSKQRDKTDLDHWYSVQSRDVAEEGGSGLLKIYDGSVMRIVMANYPEHDWKIWRFSPVESGFWIDKRNQRAFFDDLGKQLGMKTWEDWYQIKTTDVQLHGRGLLNHYGNSLVKAITTIFPEHQWKIWKFEKITEGFWQNRDHQRDFLADLAKFHNFNSWEDWYRVTNQMIRVHGGASLLILYGGSAMKAIMSVFPEHHWKLWKFSNAPDGYWDDVNNAREVIECVSKELNIKRMDDWYRVTREQLNDLGLSTLLARHGGLIPLLGAVFPQYPWDRNRLWSRSKLSKMQQLLFRFTREILGDSHGDVQMNYVHPQLRYEDTKKAMEFDIFVPSLRLALEYQGRQHFVDESLFGASSHLRSRDLLKKPQCEASGITYIETPFWWDNTKESLQATIHRHRQDIAPAGHGVAIS